MGPVNWNAVGAAWLLAAGLGVIFYGRTATPRAPYALHALAALALFVSAAMIGHMFARVGRETLGAKPWLYFMMSGGLALTFVGPSILITAIRRGQSIRSALYDAAYFLVAFLLMGGAFLALA